MAVAVRVTAAPLHSVVDGEATMLTLTGANCCTFIIMAAEEAGFPVWH